MDYTELMGFGPRGWGLLMVQAALMTVAVSATAFALGSLLGALIAWARIEGNRLLQLAADAYTTAVEHIAKGKKGTVFGGKNEVGITISELLKREASQ